MLHLKCETDLPGGNEFRLPVMFMPEIGGIVVCCPMNLFK